MPKPDQREFAITPAECLAQLPEIPLEMSNQENQEELRRVELRNALLAITETDHVSETALVRKVVQNALGRLPELEE